MLSTADDFPPITSVSLRKVYRKGLRTLLEVLAGKDSRKPMVAVSDLTFRVGRGGESGDIDRPSWAAHITDRHSPTHHQSASACSGPTALARAQQARGGPSARKASPPPTPTPPFNPLPQSRCLLARPFRQAAAATSQATAYRRSPCVRFRTWASCNRPTRCGPGCRCEFRGGSQQRGIPNRHPLPPLAGSRICCWRAGYAGGRTRLEPRWSRCCCGVCR